MMAASPGSVQPYRIMASLSDRPELTAAIVRGTLWSAVEGLQQVRDGGADGATGSAVASPVPHRVELAQAFLAFVHLPEPALLWSLVMARLEGVIAADGALCTDVLAALAAVDAVLILCGALAHANDADLWASMPASLRSRALAYLAVRSRATRSVGLRAWPRLIPRHCHFPAFDANRPCRRHGCGRR